MKTKPSFRVPGAVIRTLCAAALLAVALAVSTGSAAASGGSGTLSLTFVDATSNDPVTGACVELWKGDYEQKITDFCHTSSGASLRTLPEGTYLVHEYQPPLLPHVYRRADDREFGIGANQTSNVVLKHDRGAYIDAAAVLPDSNNSEYACFSARAVGVGVVGPVQDSGCGTIVRLYVGAGGTIAVSQDSGPDGYVWGHDVLVDTQVDGKYTATLHMTVGGGNIAVEQRDAGGARIKGGCYGFYRSPTGEQETYVGQACDSSDGEVDGIVRAKNLQPGRYRVEETQAPAGYKTGTGPDTVVVGTDEARLVHTHEPLPALNVVTTTAAGAPLAGSCWRVYTPDQHEGWVGEACDSDDGKADGRTVFGDLPAGDYELLHMSAPDGYVRIDDFMPFTMGDNELTLTYKLAALVAPANVTPPTIIGTPSSGATLTSTPGTWTGTDPTFSYAWQRCDTDGNACTPILEGWNPTYTVSLADSGHTLRLVVAAKNDAGHASATSDPTAPIVTGEPANTTLPGITGIVSVGRTLTSKIGVWTNEPTDFGFQWLRCDVTGVVCSPIAGATATTYVLTLDDVGSSFRLDVSATNSAGTGKARSLPTAVLKAYPPVLETAPTVKMLTRTVAVGTAGTWASGYGDISYAYQWLRCAADGESCDPIPGATTLNYTAPSSSPGPFTLRLQVAATNTNGTTTERSAPSIVLGPRPPVNTKVPKITGDLRFGKALGVDEGSWSSAAGKVAFGYQWLRCDADGNACEEIAGATKDGYKPGLADGGHRIRVRVTASNSEGSTDLETAPTALFVLHPPTNVIRPSVDGKIRVGSRLGTNSGRWQYEGTIHFRYRWQRCANVIADVCTDIPGATNWQYTLSNDEVGFQIRLQMWADNEQGTTYVVSDRAEVLTLHPPTSVLPPSVDGKISVGSKLGTNSGRWQYEGTIHFRYQWQRCADVIAEVCSDIPGATNWQYTLTGDDVGFRVRLQMWATNEQGTTYVASARTEVLTLHPPKNVIRPSIDGTTRVGKTLDTNSGRWEFEGLIHFRYQWQRCDANASSCVAIDGATKWQYRLTADDLGHRLVLAVWGDNGQGETLAESVASGVVTA